jgi:hypothetical protein
LKNYGCGSVEGKERKNEGKEVKGIRSIGNRSKGKIGNDGLQCIEEGMHK